MKQKIIDYLKLNPAKDFKLLTSLNKMSSLTLKKAAEASVKDEGRDLVLKILKNE